MIALVGLLGCEAPSSDFSGRNGFFKRTGEVKAVLAIRAASREIPYVVRGRGKTVASDRFQIKAPEGGAKIEQVFVELGQGVETGQSLIKFEEEELRLKLDLARSQTEEAEAAVEALRGGAKLPEPAAEESIETEEKIEETPPEKVEDRINFYEATIDRARDEIELFESQLQDMQINSPISGLVTKRETTREEAVEEGKLLIAVVRIDPLHFSFEVPLDAAPALERGTPVKVKFASMGNRQTTGDIASIGAEAGSQGQVEIRLAIPNETLVFKGEMEGEVELSTPLTRKVIAVPEKALLRTERSVYLFLAEQGKARKKAVELEGETNGQPIVRRGVREGDLVITSSVEELRDGDAVEVQTISNP